MTQRDAEQALNEAGEIEGLLSLEKLEALVERLRSYRKASAGEGKNLLSSKDAEPVKACLRLLKVGAARIELPKEVQEKWQIIEDKWASGYTLNEFDEHLSPLLQVVNDEKSQIIQTEKEVETLTERVRTLQVLADLLDELSASGDHL